MSPGFSDPHVCIPPPSAGRTELAEWVCRCGRRWHLEWFPYRGRVLGPVLRRVGSNGMVSVDNQLFSVTNAYKGELVDVFVDGSLIQVWSKNHLIRTVARAREGRVRKVRADGLHVKDQPTTNRQASTGV